jgi:hypothetical protein
MKITILQIQKNKISDIFSISVSYKVDYVNLVTAPIEHIYKTFSVNMVIDY